MQYMASAVPGRGAPLSTQARTRQLARNSVLLPANRPDALEQVSNSLVDSQKDREFREQQELLTQAAQQTDQLSEVLYKNGGASYLQVLTSETSYFSAELNLGQAQLNERLALVQLYQAVGGGWQE
jgi:multidrug efflux system outer membrane protein